MQQYVRVTRPARLHFVPTALVALALGVLPLVVGAHPASAAIVEPLQQHLLVAMMDEMSKGGGKGGGMAGMAGGQTGNGPKGANAGEMGRSMDTMCCMGAMGTPPGAGTSMTMPSALPGFPGASHLYHVGAADFFLDHADKIGLRVEQTVAINGIKQRALVDQSAAQRKIEEAEQALWVLTAADQPDIAALEPKLREIEKLKSEGRLTFIRAVGEAAKILDAEQRKMVLGMVPMPGTAPSSAHSK